MTAIENFAAVVDECRAADYVHGKFFRQRAQESFRALTVNVREIFCGRRVISRRPKFGQKYRVGISRRLD